MASDFFAPKWVQLLGAGAGFEPHDLRVMSPTSYQTALPRDIVFLMWCRRPGSNRHEGLVSPDFKSGASAYSATPASQLCHDNIIFSICQ